MKILVFRKTIRKQFQNRQQQQTPTYKIMKRVPDRKPQQISTSTKEGKISINIKPKNTHKFQNNYSSELNYA